MTQEEMEFVDSRVAYRLNRQEREKKKQREKHQKKHMKHQNMMKKIVELNLLMNGLLTWMI